MKKNSMVFIVIVILILASNHGLSQEYFVYTNNINDIMALNETVWCSTTGGIVRWNTVNGDYITYTINDGLPFNEAPGALGYDNNGNLWVSWEGIRRFDQNNWEQIYTDLPGFSTFAAHPDGSVWLGVEGVGLVRSSDGEYSVRRMPDSFFPRSVQDIEITADGIVWIASNTGVYRLDGDEWTKYTVGDGLPGNSISSLALYNGDLWALTSGGLAVFDGSVWFEHHGSDGYSFRYEYDMAVSPDGSLWFATGQYGLLRYDGSHIDGFSSDTTELASDYITKVAINSEGNAFIAITSTYENVNGLYEFGNDEVIRYRTTGPVHPSIEKITLDENGMLIFLSDSGISYFDGDIVVPLYEESDFRHHWFYELAGIRDQDGALWFAGPEGLMKEDGDFAYDLSETEELQDRALLSLAVGTDNSVWIGTDRGMVSYDRTTWTIHNESSGFNDEAVHCILSEPDGSILCGTGDGIWKYYNGDWLYLNEDYGYSSKRINAMVRDEAGVLLVSFYLGGIMTYNGESWQEFHLPPLGAPQVYDMAVDREGSIWFGLYNFGAARFRPGNVTGVADPTEHPEIIEIKRAYPNPFNNTITIEYMIPYNDTVDISIYNISGQLVRRIPGRQQSAGIHKTVWDGLSNSGMPTAAGIYIVTLESSSALTSRKITFLK